ncbi:TetR/AcrR family transcriptional regulator [Gordonia sp. KTR9]|uniref:TetR/AcrR family transcriptional regulator n=1 Tax=Gordonia sp. KTR9 TaxID=337191 RepID=UPI00027DD98E|nr:TetR/AcrR family transcriptional regulator [Gordonia sp. KTR9]AFR47461.1 Transcriptional regulator [Gordonia sp. KTR9]
MSRRPYTPRKRAISAAHTRSRILDAAQELFVAQGYSRTTLQQIADRAGVAVGTVHQAGSKASLMMAVLERGFTGDEKFVSLLERPEFIAIMEEADTARAIDRYLDHILAANSRIADLWHAATLAADSDPTIGEQLERSELRRLDDVHTGSHWFVHRNLIEDTEVDEFADILSHLTSPATYRYFTVERGWTPARLKKWMIVSIEAAMR